MNPMKGLSLSLWHTHIYIHIYIYTYTYTYTNRKTSNESTAVDCLHLLCCWGGVQCTTQATLYNSYVIVCYLYISATFIWTRITHVQQQTMLYIFNVVFDLLICTYHIITYTDSKYIRWNLCTSLVTTRVDNQYNNYNK